MCCMHDGPGLAELAAIKLLPLQRQLPPSRLRSPLCFHACLLHPAAAQAPEVLAKKGYRGGPADIWSLGAAGAVGHRSAPEPQALSLSRWS